VLKVIIRLFIGIKLGRELVSQCVRLDGLAAFLLVALPYSACMVYAAYFLGHRLIGKLLLSETNHQFF